ncbi:hypothetical protein ICN48_00725 [Polynucleobacter sp. JS-Safj-400b-B2]|uniref:transcriptional regulator domain-containing protein n=1 Tax=Polynucleobacter sp. JS-Safj-400b-B2 TaxID=2576921 RepID=UPI001C0B6CEB|nr:hypothetical protein [Polynucleobacter sp. JS-Safj-400b-B2]MBU3624764.1 hypothetical protein [Polynucleobacter sp. JS-Safj-400b-B2]
MDEATLLKKYRKKWNVPDWRFEGDYQYIEGLNPKQRRWECLRRQSSYRQEWLVHKSEKIEFINSFSLTEFIDPSRQGDDLGINFDQLYFDPLVGKLIDPEDFEDLNSEKPIPYFLRNFIIDYQATATNQSLAERIGDAVMILADLEHHFFVFDPKAGAVEQKNTLGRHIKELLELRSQDEYYSRNRNSTPKVIDNIVKLLRVQDCYNEFVEVHGSDAKLKQAHFGYEIFKDEIDEGEQDVDDCSRKKFSRALGHVRKLVYCKT